MREIRIFHKHRKIWPSLVVIRGMSASTSTKDSYTLSRLTKIKHYLIPSMDKEAELKEVGYIAGPGAHAQNPFGNSWAQSSGCEWGCTFRAQQFLCTDVQDAHRGWCTGLPNGKQSKQLPTARWAGEFQYVHQALNVSKLKPWRQFG